jgi:Ser/Thr protein kinase RdoA (MazF antagonist)
MPSTKTSVSETTTDRAVRLYGFEPQAQLPVVKGYRNETHPIRCENGEIVNLIIYKSEPNIVAAIKNANSVSNFLAKHNFPARRSLDERILQLKSNGSSRYAALYNFLPGETIAWEAYGMKHLKLLGQTMSNMHAALQVFDARDLFDVIAIYLEIFTRMQRYFAEPGVRNALARKLTLVPPNLDESIATLQACKHVTEVQALHMDFVRSNILFDDVPGGLAISGILDFEKTARGPRLFDIARTLAFLLVDCKYKPADKVRNYFLHSGYAKRGALNFQNVAIKTKRGEINLLENLLTIFLLHDFYKFLRHNPYESLPQNEHFTRTRDLLLRRHRLGLTLGVSR